MRIDLDEPDWKRDAGPSPFDNPKANAVALPLAFGLAFLLNLVGIGLITMLFSHEFGHGIAAWFCGRYAFPIPIAGYTFWGLERSYPVIILLFSALAYLWNYARKENLYALYTLCTFLILVQGDLTFLTPTKQQEAVMIWGGSGGELILSTLVLLAFYYRLSSRLRWDFWRWPLIVAAACSFLFAAQSWNRAQEDPQKYVMGGASTGSSRDKDADWVRLVEAHGWTPERVVASYVLTTQACVAVLALHYLFFLFAAGRAPAREESAAE